MKHVAIIGGGQLARMLALAGIPMGIRFSFLLEEGQEDNCVLLLGDCVRYKKTDSYENIYLKLGCPDVITVENENVEIALLEGLSKHTKVSPSPQAVSILKNRINEKLLLTANGTVTARYFPFYSYTDLIENVGMLRFPIVLKSATGGYDGKKQHRIGSPTKLLDYGEAVLADIDFSEGYIAEEFQNFEREISFLAVRSSEGKMKFYPPTENIHHQAVLTRSIAPASSLCKRAVKKAYAAMTEMMESLDYVGVMAMECFQLNIDGEQELCVNEISPRVHNSGHWTQSASATSQFENHLRAILDLPLGSSKHFGYAAMVNILGKQKVNLSYLPQKATLHWYDKQERDGRKMGHINLVGDCSQQIARELSRLNRFLDSDMSLPAGS